MSRTGLQRLDAVEPAVARRDEFLARLKAAAGDAVRLADMMAEAIGIHRESRPLEPVGKDGRSFLCIEELMAMHCIDGARTAYLAARGSNTAAREDPAAQSQEPSR